MLLSQERKQASKSTKDLESDWQVTSQHISDFPILRQKWVKFYRLGLAPDVRKEDIQSGLDFAIRNALESLVNAWANVNWEWKRISINRPDEFTSGYSAEFHVWIASLSTKGWATLTREFEDTEESSTTETTLGLWRLGKSFEITQQIAHLLLQNSQIPDNVRALITVGNIVSNDMEALLPLDQFHTARDVEEAINTALANDQFSLARELAMKGHERFPDDKYLKQASLVLAPPKLLSKNIPPKKGLAESMDWIRAHGSEHKGEWIAVQQGRLVASVPSRKELIQELGEKAKDSDIVITFLP